MNDGTMDEEFKDLEELAPDVDASEALSIVERASKRRAARVTSVVGALTLVVLVGTVGWTLGDSEEGSSQDASTGQAASDEIVIDSVLVSGGTVSLLLSGCFIDADATFAIQGEQVIVSDLRGDPAPDDSGTCSASIDVDGPVGPDVVYPEGEQRFALVGDDYVPVDYCGVDIRRCVDVEVDPGPASCSQASLQYWAGGLGGGAVYPASVDHCEDGWAVVTLEVCNGFLGRQDPRCSEGPRTLLLVSRDGRWLGTGFKSGLFCPDAAATYGAPDLPDWVCDFDVTGDG